MVTLVADYFEHQCVIPCVAFYSVAVSLHSWTRITLSGCWTYWKNFLYARAIAFQDLMALHQPTCASLLLTTLTQVQANRLTLTWKWKVRNFIGRWHSFFFFFCYRCFLYQLELEGLDWILLVQIVWWYLIQTGILLKTYRHKTGHSVLGRSDMWWFSAFLQLVPWRNLFIHVRCTNSSFQILLFLGKWKNDTLKVSRSE